ncbi:MAG: hypothetical protein ACHQQQ_11840 [Bacteroidota bacterium]
MSPPQNIILTIDIAHPPLRPEDAEMELERGLRTIESSENLRVLKIIHGYGSGGTGGTLKTLAQNWAFRKQKRCRAIYDGASLNPFSKDIQKLMVECGLSVNEIGGNNEGITMVWVK